ncbi:hypothetical protein I79_001581 [Cricetulus griseus]|uniref:Uncharacterized protein n=1 Tax=Cricetulus griseus TaxID=10029 RepID=G3GV50_CRIGR|nr:hypothetical protein I79_001581 [Cricetulus griseus]
MTVEKQRFKRQGGSSSLPFLVGYKIKAHSRTDTGMMHRWTFSFRFTKTKQNFLFFFVLLGSW